MRTVVGFTGLARSGKDTAANALVAHYAAHRYSFADPMREMLKAIGVDSEAVVDKEAVIPHIGKSLRELMQTLGTEWGRSLVHKDLWVLEAKRRLDALVKAGRFVTIADVRFNNEAKMITDNGGVVVRIVRPGVAKVRNHISESGIDDLYVWRTIVNDRTEGEFIYKVLSLTDDL